MLKRVRFIVVAVTLILLPLLVACGEPQASTQPTAVAQPTDAGGGGTGNTPTTVNVDMTGFKYVPETITIGAGSTVVWVNKEAAPHTVTEDNNAFDSGQMKKDAVYERKFDTPGTISYYCIVHGKGMSGKVVVTAAPGGGGAVDTPAAQIPPTVPPTAAVEPPTVSLPTATTAVPEPPKSNGSVRFRDENGRSDQAVVSIDALPETATGKAQFAWLVNAATGASVNLGRVTTSGTGGYSLTFSAPDNANLLALYDTFRVTHEELESTPTTPSSDVALQGAIPPKALVHVRHLLVAFDKTPNNTALVVGLLDQATAIRRHAEFLRDAQAQGNKAALMLHAEHLVNMIEGTKGANFGDLDKNGEVTNPGDGYGMLPGGDQLGYLLGTKDHAELAAAAADATEEIKVHAGHVVITADNVTGWMTTIRDRALEVSKTTDMNASAPLVADVLKLANQSINGVDLQGDGQILPVPGSGGALTSYQHSQLVATIKVGAGAGTGDVQTQPTAASVQPTVAPVQPTAVPSGGSEKTVPMDEFKFVGGPTTVKVGTTVTWVNEEAAPHTATADNGSFDSGTLQKGQSFSFTFKAAGEFKYYCVLHGGPDGQGMASVMTVEP